MLEPFGKLSYEDLLQSTGENARFEKDSQVKDMASTKGLETGMILMVCAVVLASVVHALAKALGTTLATSQIAFARFFFQIFFLLPLVLYSHQGRIPAPSFAQLARGGLLAGATLCFFTAVTYMPLSDSVAIFFVGPLILILMSAVFLHEPIGIRRILAVAIGFAGALIVIRPRFETLGVIAVLPLLAAACFATYITVTRKLAKSENAWAMQFWISIFASFVLGLTMIAGSFFSIPKLQPSWPSLDQWGLLFSLGAVATGSSMLAINAIRRTPASILAPFQYLEIFGATALGVLVFNDVPDATTLIGVMIIVSSGLYVFWRERKLASSPQLLQN